MWDLTAFSSLSLDMFYGPCRGLIQSLWASLLESDLESDWLDV